MTLNIEDYRKHFADLNLSRDEETALIASLIAVAECFVDLAHGMHPSQHADVMQSNDSTHVFDVVKLADQAANDNEQEDDTAAHAT